MGVNLIAALWGIAEATLFFIVPDVWLSIVGRENLRVGLIACLYSLLGAIVGGVIMYVWGWQELAGAIGIIEKIPAISTAMVNRVHTDLIEQGVMAMILGPLSGTPYKIFAIQASDTGIGIWLFVLTTIPARLIRFILVTVFCHYALKILAYSKLGRNKLVALITGWMLFYLLYFSMMPG